MENITVKNTIIRVQKINKQEYISLTDIAKYKDSRSGEIIKNWLRNRQTIEFLGLWERINNKDFNVVEFDHIRNQSGLNSFVLTSTQWIKKTSAMGLTGSTGRYGGTYAHKDIAFEFATWISVEFKLFLIKEFQRLKEFEEKELGWDIKRNLAKINYKILTTAIEENLIPKKLRNNEIEKIYANEADILNMALFGMTAKEWREQRRDKKGNIRDYANSSQLVCLSNLESMNAELIKLKLNSPTRLQKLNEIAISQMKILTKEHIEKTLLKRNNSKLIE